MLNDEKPGYPVESVRSYEWVWLGAFFLFGLASVFAILFKSSFGFFAQFLMILTGGVLLTFLLMAINQRHVRIAVTENEVVIGHYVWRKTEVYNRLQIVCWTEFTHTGDEMDDYYSLYCFYKDKSYFCISSLGVQNYNEIKHAITYGITENVKITQPEIKYFRKLPGT